MGFAHNVDYYGSGIISDEVCIWGQGSSGFLIKQLGANNTQGEIFFRTHETIQAGGGMNWEVKGWIPFTLNDGDFDSWFDASDKGILDSINALATGKPDTFTELQDTPSDYTGKSGYYVVVNATEDGIEFVSGGGGSVIPQCFLGGKAYVDENIVYFRISKAMTLSKVRIGAVTAPTGASLIVDVNYHATDPTAMTTIFVTQTNRPTIADGAHTGDSGTPNITSLAEGGWIGISIDQVGSIEPGADITVELIPA